MTEDDESIRRVESVRRVMAAVTRPDGSVDMDALRRKTLVDITNAAGRDYQAARTQQHRLSAFVKLASAIEGATMGELTSEGAHIVAALKEGFAALRDGEAPPQFQREKKLRQPPIRRLKRCAFFEAGRRLLRAAGHTNEDAFVEIRRAARERHIPLPEGDLNQALKDFRTRFQGPLVDRYRIHADNLVTMWQGIGARFRMTPEQTARCFLDACGDPSKMRAPYLHSAAETHENEAEQGNSAAVLPFSRK